MTLAGLLNHIELKRVEEMKAEAISLDYSKLNEDRIRSLVEATNRTRNYRQAEKILSSF